MYGDTFSDLDDYNRSFQGRVSLFSEYSLSQFICPLMIWYNTDSSLVQ